MPAIGETDLDKLLTSLRPRLAEPKYVFASVPAQTTLPAGLRPLMQFEELEGTTLILLEAEATAAGIKASFPCRMITLDVHSSLEAVGLVAAVATRLAAAGISVNPVSAFHHDHLFVPQDKAEQALQLLNDMAAAATSATV